MRWLLIRHGESTGNQEWRLQGQKEFALSRRGRRQAELLARRLAGMGVAALYSSPIRRAWDTAAVVARRLGLAIQPLPGVMEYDFGELSGLTWAEICQRAPDLAAAIASRGSEYPCFPGEEGRESFRQRVCAALWGLRESHSDETVAVVTHAGPIAAFVLDVLGLPVRPPLPFNLDNGSITVVETPSRPWPGAPDAVLVSLNDVCHLKEEE
ncbi:MAG: histidine phosphatase family protein [Dehalococcoidia bacterium]